MLPTVSQRRATRFLFMESIFKKKLLIGYLCNK
jgi:hypothetical protein